MTGSAETFRRLVPSNPGTSSKYEAWQLLKPSGKLIGVCDIEPVIGGGSLDQSSPPMHAVIISKGRKPRRGDVGLLGGWLLDDCDEGPAGLPDFESAMGGGLSWPKGLDIIRTARLHVKSAEVYPRLRL